MRSGAAACRYALSLRSSLPRHAAKRAGLVSPARRSPHRRAVYGRGTGALPPRAARPACAKDAHAPRAAAAFASLGSGRAAAAPNLTARRGPRRAEVKGQSSGAPRGRGLTATMRHRPKHPRSRTQAAALARGHHAQPWKFAPSRPIFSAPLKAAPGRTCSPARRGPPRRCAVAPRALTGAQQGDKGGKHMPVKPVTVSAQQHILNAVRSVERAQQQVQQVHGQVTPAMLKRLALLQGLARQLAGLVGASPAP